MTQRALGSGREAQPGPWRPGRHPGRLRPPARLGATSLRGWRIRAVDLRHRSAELGDLRVAGALFLGCRFAAGDAERVEARGAIVVPDLPVAPVDLHLDHLYRPEDLYDAPTYADSLDARAYAWSQTAHDRDAHDGEGAARPRRRRGPDRLGGRPPPGRRDGRPRAGAGHRRATSTPPASGCGWAPATWSPPAAAPARWRPRTSAGTWPRSTPRRRPATRRWPCWPPSRRSARRSTPGCAPASRCSTGSPAAPTPSASRPGSTGTSRPTCWRPRSPSTCATPSARRSCSRSATPASSSCPAPAGTVQEVFQDACENYYADESSVAPMVLVGRTYWTETLPAWPLLETAGPRSSDGAARPPRRRRGRGRGPASTRW